VLSALLPSDSPARMPALLSDGAPLVSPTRRMVEFRDSSAVSFVATAVRDATGDNSEAASEVEGGEVDAVSGLKSEDNNGAEKAAIAIAAEASDKAKTAEEEDSDSLSDADMPGLVDRGK
jgi:hypothetical protein